MDITFSQIDAWLAAFLWPFCRLGGLLMTMSITGTRSVSARIRLILAVLVTVTVAPSIPAMPSISLFSLASLVIVGQELLIGIALGFITRIFLEVFVVAGQLVSLQTGLGFGSLVDPVNGASVPLVGQAFLICATLLFVIFDGHLLMIEIAVMSFHSIPVGLDSIGKIDWFLLADLGRWMFAGGLIVALAAVLALLMLNLAFGILTRATPQLNLFVIGFPATMVSGFILLWIVASDFTMHFDREFSRMREVSCQLVGLRC